MMRIVIDMQGAQTLSRFRGVGRYCIAAVEELIEQSNQDEIYIILNGMFPESVDSIRSHFEPLVGKQRIRTWFSPWHSKEAQKKRVWGLRVDEIIREQLIKSLSPDVVLLTGLLEDGFNDHAVTTINEYGSEVPTVAFMYDLIPLVYQEEYLDPWPDYKSWYLAKVKEIGKLGGVACISESSCEEVLRYVDISEERVHNINGGVAERFQKCDVPKEEEDEIRASIGLDRPFVMYTGGSDFRKNLHRLVKAFSHLPGGLREGYQLLLVGDISTEHIAALKETARRCGLDEIQVVFSGYVNEETLVFLYNMADAFVFPSIHEGLGFPALEAMACGVPVIGADAPGVRDAIADSDALFNPRSEVEIAGALSRVLDDEPYRKMLVQRGLARAKLYTWRECGRQLRKLIDSLVREQPAQAQGKRWSRAQAGSHLRTEIEKEFRFRPTVTETYRIGNAVDESLPRFRKRHLFIDITDIVQNDARTGIQRVVRAILCALLKQEDSEWVIRPIYGPPNEGVYRYADSHVSSLFGLPWPERKNELVESDAGDVFFGLDWSPVGSVRHGRAIRQMYRKGVQVIFVVYDLLPLLLPDRFERDLAEAYREWVDLVLKFDGAVCISRTVAEELKQLVKDRATDQTRRFDITWFPLGCDIEASVPSRGDMRWKENVIEYIQQNTLTFLVVGTVEPRKCHEQIFNAFSLLWENNHDVSLVFVGKLGWVSNTLVHRLRHANQKNRRFFWLESVNDEYLEVIYKNVDCLIAASEGEGYGLPVVEAASHGVSVIARDIPVFREVLGNSAYFFSGVADSDLSLAVEEWIELWRRGAHPKPDRINVINWKSSAQILLEEVESIWTRANLGSHTLEQRMEAYSATVEKELTMRE